MKYYTCIDLCTMLSVILKFISILYIVEDNYKGVH